MGEFTKEELKFFEEAANVYKKVEEDEEKYRFLEKLEKKIEGELKKEKEQIREKALGVNEKIVKMTGEKIVAFTNTDDLEEAEDAIQKKYEKEYEYDMEVALCESKEEFLKRWESDFSYYLEDIGFYAEQVRETAKKGREIVKGWLSE